MTFRILTREEAATVPGMVDPMPSSLAAVGAVDESGAVVCCIGLFLVLHADPLWIREDHRHSGKLPLHLWEAAREFASSLGPEVFVGMSDTKPGPGVEDTVAAMIQKAGGQEIDARFFVIPTGVN